MAEDLEILRAKVSEDAEWVTGLSKGVAHALGLTVGHIFTDRYLHGLSWDQIAYINGVGKATAIRKARVACEWISGVGLRRAEAGLGIAEGDF